ncbi:MAG: TldD/PmbA family protein [Methanobacteriota archaeon]
MDLAPLLSRAGRIGASYADARHETTFSSALEWRSGEMTRMVQGTEEGVGLRALVSGAWGLASTNRLGTNAAKRLPAQAVEIAKALTVAEEDRVRLSDVKPRRTKAIWKPKKDPRRFGIDERLRLVRLAEDELSDRGRLASYTIGVSDEVTRTVFASSEGARVETLVARALIQMEAVARRGAKVVSYRTRIGGTGGFELLTTGEVRKEAKEARDGALRLLSARAPKGERTTVVTDHDLTGVFAHEAIGHASEADLVAAGESILKGRIGEKLGNPLVTIVDDASVPQAYGSFPFDDEGVEAGRKMLVENGVVAGYITSRETAAKLGLSANGGARAESYSDRPIVRMSNTLIAPGDHSEEEIFEDVKKGIYCCGTRGGQVDTAKGSFQFACQEAFEIRDGALGRPLRDVSLMGDILTTLNNIDALGKHTELASPGICGKGQWIPVCDGGPKLRIRDCVVGGQA